ncbi:cofilin [Pancytospora philotis]|nr:cofilin [Pancytospora philotis]
MLCTDATDGSQVQPAIVGMGDIEREVQKLLAHKQKFVVFDFASINPITARIVSHGGVDSSADLRATPSMETLHRTFAECRGKLDPSNAYFVVYDFGYYNDRDCYRDLVVFISYVPDSLSARQKMAYASNVASVLAFLGLAQHIETHEMDEFTFESIYAECMRIQRK